MVNQTWNAELFHYIVSAIVVVPRQMIIIPRTADSQILEKTNLKIDFMRLPYAQAPQP